MADIKPCLCGKTPGRLSVTEGASCKWAWATCDQCGEWSIEFRTGYSQDFDVLQARAVEAWNSAPRGGVVTAERPRRLIDVLHKAVTDANVYIAGQPYSPRQQQEKMLAALIRAIADEVVPEEPEPIPESPAEMGHHDCWRQRMAIRQRFLSEADRAV